MSKYEYSETRCYNMSLPQYIKQKIKLLRKEFCINLTREQVEHFSQCTSEIQVDNYARDILMNY